MDNKKVNIDSLDTLEKGDNTFSYLLDCVRNGRRTDIEKVFSSDDHYDLVQLIILNGMSFSNSAFKFLLPQVLRVAIDEGVTLEQAISMYENYIQRTEKAKSIYEIIDICRQMFYDFSDRVNYMKNEYQFSWVVRKCRSYINDNIYTNFSIYDIAEELKISTSYLSHQYKTETQETILSYIRRQKISKAKQLLRYTSLSYTEIGEKLGYCTQSNFINNFRKETGMTPGEYCSRNETYKNRKKKK